MAVLAPSRPLIERSARELAHALRTREASARDVVEAHIEQLERTHAQINAIVADRYDDARADADAVDALVASTADSDTLPPLLGVPCTIKEAIAVAGMPHCAGLVSRCQLRSTENAPTVQRMFDAGAILLGVTNTASCASGSRARTASTGVRATPMTRLARPAAPPAGRAP